jgi:hypothetical protein
VGYRIGVDVLKIQVPNQLPSWNIALLKKPVVQQIVKKRPSLFVHCRGYKNPKFVPPLSQTNPVPILPSNFLKGFLKM